MAYPPGISLAVIQVGKAGTFFGDGAGLTATVTPVLGKTKYLVHESTGDLMVPSPMTFTASNDSVLSFSVPHVDQDGYLDDNAQPYTMWAYKVDVTVLIGNGRQIKKHTWTKNFQPVVGQDFIDIDKIASGVISEGLAAPSAVVTSVVGKTGSITAQDLVDAGVGGGDSSLALTAAKDYTDEKLAGYAEVEDVPELGDGLYFMGADGTGMWMLDGDGKLAPTTDAVTFDVLDDYTRTEEIEDLPPGVYVGGSDGTAQVLVEPVVEEVPEPVAVPVVPAPTFTLPTTGTMTTLSVSILNQANRYLLNTWIPAALPGTGTVTWFGGTGEAQIRHPAAAAFGLAAAVATGAHNATTTGHTPEATREQARRIVAGLAAKHKANGGDWGGVKDTPPPNGTNANTSWQSALWAYYMGSAGWLIWSALSDTEKLQVLAVVRWEADRMLRWRLPFWKKPDGATNYAGDSKAEEISWDAAVVSLATVMMPTDPQVPAWNAKLVEMGYASHAAPADITATNAVNGFAGADVLTGYNINDNGTVINHDRIHPDYMVSAGGSHWGFLFAYGATKQDAPKALQHNAAKIYAALSTLNFDGATYAAPGGTIYISGSGEFYYPEGNDWGTHRVMDKALMDVLAYRNGWDAGIPTPAYQWAGLHLQRQADLQARGTDGRTYQAPEEDTYSGREQWVAANAAFAVLNLAAPATRVSNAVPDIITSRNRSI